jgi:DNA-binding MarR family transcriptional regulator
MLDRMETLKLIVRTREGDDRRFVTARISGAGLKMLAALDPVVDRLTDAQVGHLGDTRLRTLINLLGRVRDRP